MTPKFTLDKGGETIATQIPPIHNTISEGNLHVVELTDRSRIQFYVQSMADQINSSRQSHGNNGTSSRVRDLSQFIADIVIETTVQGASLLEVHVIDPAWTLFRRDANGNCFIDADDQGYLWPPIEVNWPPKVSDSFWRLAQARPSTDLTGPNVILTFEDKIASQLREHAGPKQASSGQTRADFIQSLIKDASDHPAFPTDGPIRFIPLMAAGTFSPPPAPPHPKSAQHGRNNPNKLSNITGQPPKTIAIPQPQSVEISIADGVSQLAHQIGLGLAGKQPNGLDIVPGGTNVGVLG